ncbi:mechanosensitive ion channel family protein [Glutamicibacter sp. MNS18]|uniref:mechanosensitive ion channel family protein n=1 Tax=Glutamicibacter sp. MNS18 TaxID=2989817 RepID=UPI00223613DF|nr:mechanosensitive ion channel family protein [Glutamicibacter sp. MNS18]MCW4467165.1 mechanosensitive ion channel family protein [Glutamicibacter sp. MNS18]
MSPTEPIEETVSEVVEASNFLPESLRFWAVVAVGLLLVAVLTFVLSFVFSRVFRHSQSMQQDIASTRLPFFGALASVVVKSTLLALHREQAGYEIWQFIWLVLLVMFVTWFLIRLAKAVENFMLERLEKKFGNGRKLAKVQTQMGLLRRVIAAILIVIAIAAILLTIEQVRALGAGILASAGLLSVVVGLAIQTPLANVFAGMQVAFTDAIRVGDIIVVEDERGTVEEITLSYVVVLLLNGRRMILPSTYFTTTPFENWSRRTTEISGTVVLELKWNAPVDYLRRRTGELLESSDLWDGRSNSLVVTDAVGGLQTVTIFLSARNPGDLWDLSNMVRERLLQELLEDYPESLPDPRIRPEVR